MIGDTVAWHIFRVQVDEIEEPLTEVGVEGLEEAFQTIEAVTDVAYVGLSNENVPS